MIANEFRFLGGSIGRVARRTVSRRRTPCNGRAATDPRHHGVRGHPDAGGHSRLRPDDRDLPAIMDHRAAGLPYLVHLRHPTTGGVYASWGSLGHVTVAEPGAPDRVPRPQGLRGARRAPLPRRRPDRGEPRRQGSHRRRRRRRGASHAGRSSPRRPGRPAEAREPCRVAPAGSLDPSRSAWSSIELTRAPDRAGVRDLLRVLQERDRFGCRGTDEGEHDAAVLLALTRIDGEPCVVVGQDRSSPGRRLPWVRPHCARRAGRWAWPRSSASPSLPSSTPRAPNSPPAEEGAVAGEIARCLARWPR